MHASKPRSLTIGQLFGAFASSAHRPVCVARWTFVNGTLELGTAGAARAFHKRWTTMLVNEWMIAGRWTDGFFADHNLAWHSNGNCQTQNRFYCKWNTFCSLSRTSNGSNASKLTVFFGGSVYLKCLKSML